MQTTTANVTLSNPAAVLKALGDHLADHDVVMRQEGDLAIADLPSGQARFRVASPALEMQASAPSQAALEDVIGFLASHVLEFAHPERPTIQWEGFKARSSFADFRLMTVVRVADLTSRMRRITLHGDDLERFDTLENLHVRLFFPQPGVEPQWPERGEDGLARPVDPARRPLVRKYTIRGIDRRTSEVEVDFVLHADAGPGSAWAERVAVGDRCGMAGPGGRGVKPADWLLLAGDETALPAIARALETLPAGTRGMALIEVQNETDRLTLSGPAGMAVRWLHRADGSVSLAEAVKAIAVPENDSRFCWAGAEFEAIQEIRRHWRDDVGLAKDEQLAVAYWRRGHEDA